MPNCECGEFVPYPNLKDHHCDDYVEESMTLFEHIKLAGIPFDSHESDLYVKATKESAAIIKEHGPNFVSAFRDELTGETWFDVAFKFDPFWEVK